jgi:pilus assembly protein Flp/PilA
MSVVPDHAARTCDDKENLMKMIRSLMKDDSAVTAIEYALIAGGIGIAIAIIVVNVGSALEGVFTTVESSLSG